MLIFCYQWEKMQTNESYAVQQFFCLKQKYYSYFFKFKTNNRSRLFFYKFQDDGKWMNQLNNKKLSIEQYNLKKNISQEIWAKCFHLNKILNEIWNIDRDTIKNKNIERRNFYCFFHNSVANYKIDVFSLYRNSIVEHPLNMKKV